MNARLTAYVLLQRLGGSRVGRAYDDFLRAERMSGSAYAAFCDARLSRVLAHAVAHVPYYRERVPLGAVLGDFPVLTKSAVRSAYRDLMSDRLRRDVDRDRRSVRGYGWVEVQSGGTTGAPTSVIHDAPFRDSGRASRLYSQYLCGFPFGTPYTMLWGSMRDINQKSDSLAKRILNRLGRFELLNAFQMSDSNLDAYLDRLSQRRVRHLMAYVDAADVLASRAIARKRTDVRLASVMACAGTVTDAARTRIHSAFGARVHNKYGSRECTDMACECDHGSIHVFGHHVHLEIVGDDGSPVAPGGLGRVLVTLLGNDAFPLIRYEIGDLARRADSPCVCGRPLPTIGAIEGRTVEALTDVQGMYVSPVYFRHLIGVVHNPAGVWRRFQVRQRAVGRYMVSLEARRSGDGGDLSTLLESLRADLAAVLGRTALIECAVVERIPEEASGKFLYVVNDTVLANTSADHGRA